MKKYQVIIQDEYNNLYHIGFYDNLSDSVEEINSFLETYNVSIDGLKVYPSTFNECFDTEIETPDGNFIMVRGFIFDD